MARDVIKDLEIRNLSWIIQEGPKGQNKYPYKRGTEAD